MSRMGTGTGISFKRGALVSLCIESQSQPLPHQSDWGIELSRATEQDRSCRMNLEVTEAWWYRSCEHHPGPFDWGQL